VTARRTWGGTASTVALCILNRRAAFRAGATEPRRAYQPAPPGRSCACRCWPTRTFGHLLASPGANIPRTKVNKNPTGSKPEHRRGTPRNGRLTQPAGPVRGKARPLRRARGWRGPGLRQASLHGYGGDWIPSQSGPLRISPTELAGATSNGAGRPGTDWRMVARRVLGPARAAACTPVDRLRERRRRSPPGSGRTSSAGSRPGLASGSWGADRAPIALAPVDQRSSRQSATSIARGALPGRHGPPYRGPRTVPAGMAGDLDRLVGADEGGVRTGRITHAAPGVRSGCQSRRGPATAASYRRTAEPCRIWRAHP